MLSHQDMEYFVKVSEHAPIEKNMDILFDGLRIGDLECSALFRKCAEKTGTKVMNWKLIRRWQRAYYLARYFDYALGLSGARVECGVFQGFSALILLEVARMRDPRFSGDGVHLVDSFAGLSEPTEGDAIETRVLPDGQSQFAVSHSAGDLAAPLGSVKAALADFPGLIFHEGWIPEVLDQLPAATWSFVHIDVDLYEPTKACLEYFGPRMVEGGVIVNDDFASPMFPGAGLAWREYCDAHGLPYVVLDTGQAVLIQQS